MKVLGLDATSQASKQFACLSGGTTLALAAFVGDEAGVLGQLDILMYNHVTMYIRTMMSCKWCKWIFKPCSNPSKSYVSLVEACHSVFMVY